MAIGNPITLTSNVASKTISVIATAGQTLFTVTGGYRINQLAVFRNGVRLLDSRDYEARNGATVTLLSAATIGDALEFQVFDDFRVADAIVSAESEQTISGNLTVSGILTATDLRGSDVTFRHVKATGISTVSDTTQSTTTTTGALIVSGGLGVAKNLFVGGSMNVAGTLTYEDVTNSETAGVTTTGGLVVTGLGATFGSGVGIADSIYHLGDDNTAIRFPGNDTFTVTTSGSEALRVDSSQRLVVGADASVQVAGSHPFVQHHGNKTTTNLAVAGYANNSGGSILALGASRSTTVGTPGTVVSNNDILGDIRFAGDDGTDINSIAAAIRGEVDGAPGSNDMPGRLIFATTADGAASATERLRITSGGLVGINCTPLAQFQVKTGTNANILMSTMSSEASIEVFNDAGNANVPFRLRATEHKFFISGDEKLRIDTSGRLLINTSTSRIVEDHVGNGPSGLIQIEGTNSDAIMSIISAGTADANRCGTISLGRHRNSTVGGTPTIVQDGDALGAVMFSAGDGTDMRTAGAKIHAEVDGTPGSNDMPGALVFSTTPDGSSTPGSSNERLRIDKDGSVTKPTNPLLKTNMGNVYGGNASLHDEPDVSILQSNAEIDKGNNGWSTSGANAYTFVCPVAGVYAIHAHFSLDDIAQGSRVIWSMAYTDGGGNLPLSNYVEVMDTNVHDYQNYSYFNTFIFSAGTRVGFGINDQGSGGTKSGFNSQWGIYLLQ